MARLSRRWALVIVGLAVAIGVALQFAGPARTNPRADADLALEQQTQVPARVAGVLRRACYDCHSHDTRWPWYSRVAPVSWLVVYDVDTAREYMNLSTWGSYHRFERADLLDKACDLAADGTMPLRRYVWLHPGARLAPADVEALCAWTRAESARLTRAPVP